MKYRWILGFIIPLTACGNGSNGGGSGGSAQMNSGGSSTNPTSGGSAGAGTMGGATSSSGGSGNATQGGSSQGGNNTGNRGGTSNGTGGGTAGGNAGGNNASGGATNPMGGQAGAATSGGSSNGGSMSTGNNNVLERNGGPTREGHWVQPALTKSAAAKMALETGFAATFKGSMYASPLYVENGPGGKGVFIAVSADNVVAALDETTGATVWTKTLGTSPGAKGQACGFGSDPVGILSTPVIDGKTGTIYVAVATGTAAVEKHEVHALSIMDGSSKAGWPVNVSAMKAGSVSFNTKYQNQRSALSLANGIVYVAYGGFVGDCGDYHGWVVAIDAADPTKTGAFATAGAQEAIWAAGGFASDGMNVFPVTGNGKATSRDAADSEAILKINGLAKFDRTNANMFYPSAWKSMDSADADLGGTNSLLMKIPGSSMPDSTLIAVGKDGTIYLVNPSNLGGSDGQIAKLSVASVGQVAGNGVKTAPTAYTTAKGTYLALTVQSGADCPNNITGAAVVGVKITGGTQPTAEVAWCAPGPNPPAAPISTTTDGKTDPIVWYVANGQLKGVDGDTGATVFEGTSGGSCAGVQRWTSPIAVKGRIVAGANGKLCSWKPSM